MRRILLHAPILAYVIPHTMHTGTRVSLLSSASSSNFHTPRSSYSIPRSKSDTMVPEFTEVGSRDTLEYRGFFKNEKNELVSPWHFIPYKCNETGLYNMVVEIPRHSTAKLEIATELENNPIKQDVMKDGSLRYLDCPYYWNYGAIPQTWESPEAHSTDDSCSEGLRLVGDNDPVDAIDVSQTTVSSGSVVPVKVVGALALVDEGEIDWKMFVVRKDDPNFDKINDLEDIDKFYPGTTTGIQEFYRWYKTPKGKALNSFLSGKTFINRQEAVKILEDTHECYLKLRRGELKKGKLWVPEA